MSRELFGIANAELNLEAGTVQTNYPVRAHGCVGEEVKKRISVLKRTAYNTDVAFQYHRIYDHSVTPCIDSFRILI